MFLHSPVCGVIPRRPAVLPRWSPDTHTSCFCLPPLPPSPLAPWPPPVIVVTPQRPLIPSCYHNELRSRILFKAFLTLLIFFRDQIFQTLSMDLVTPSSRMQELAPELRKAFVFVTMSSEYRHFHLILPCFLHTVTMQESNLRNVNSPEIMHVQR